MTPAAAAPKSVLARLLLVGAVCLLSACAGSAPPRSVSAAVPGDADSGAAGAKAAAATAAYCLGAGDQLRVIVFGEEDLSGEFEVDDTGAVSLPLIGQVVAKDLTLRSFEAAVQERLQEGYLKDPRVSVQVLSYRPFYIIGEVDEPGEYPFVSGMNVLNAVALSGGFTPRANTSKVLITRGGHESAYPVTHQTHLEPGDMIRIPERFF
ncbi:MAG: polysaccharide export protein [bacterium]|nr:polysaccharide biosynthesis protein [Deltaproteobacteria bacterium]MCP4239346.1 polysaccharide export protein [bacterium]MDP6244844.1 polysaccharide biosynthesis/export family protein [Myxococcota bacterium]